jgi:two-component system, OmpR family, phosphate regulon sensor histidine kinase PhoR
MQRLRWLRRVPLLWVIVPIALGSAIALSRTSYRYASIQADRAEQSLADSYRLIGSETLERVDNFIVDSDRQFFDLVDLDHLQDFARQWGTIVRLSPAIEAALVLDEHLEPVQGASVSKKKVAGAEAFRGVFMQKIRADLPLAALPTNSHRHMHKSYDGHDYLISFIKRERDDGQIFYIVLKISLEYVVKVFFPDVFQRLQGQVVFCVRDAEGGVVYGTPIEESGAAVGRLLFEGRFPTTLYRWRLQMVPTRAGALAFEERQRRRSDVALTTLMLAVLLAGMGFIVYASIKESSANKLKSDFISNVSHELKTPLSVIRMFSELLSTERVRAPEKVKEYGATITREAERLSRLIENVLDFSRMERGGTAYEFQEGRLDAVVERALDVYRHRIEREGLRLVTKIDAGLPSLSIDENAMTLLLLNLLENAVKYGKGEIAVYLTRVGNRLRLVVGDQGPGIPREEQRKIFERFYRTQAARRTNVRGSGIGLSLVKHIAEAHGGTVTLDSDSGKGAAFLVDLPIPDPVPAERAVV